MVKKKTLEFLGRNYLFKKTTYIPEKEPGFKL